MQTDNNGLTRVACLYRVSTKKQMDKNDIPMQKNACRAFIADMADWVLTREYIEKGVSGYHKSAEERDVLKQARYDAERGLFDVLLVFMFDRLGRREDETPFVVEWFVKQGVAVWSVKEGRQTFDNRVDKLLNYIRFWQSGGESEKTSIRVKEKHRQMVLDGQFRGGGAPFGYRLVDTGKTNKKGIMLKKLVIDETESEVVRTIFRLASEQGYGGRRIAGYLNERGLLTKRGNHWTPSSITDLLKNPLYKGRYVSGKRPSRRGGSKRVPPDEWIYARDAQPDLALVDESLWNKAEALRKARSTNSEHVPKQTRGPLLLIGLAKCADCENRLRSRHAARPAYRCPGGDSCAGQKNYAQHKIDTVVLAVCDSFWQRLPTVDITDALNARLKTVAAAKAAVAARQVARIAQAEKDLCLLKDEIAKSLRDGKHSGAFSPAQLAEAIRDKEQALCSLREQQLRTKEDNCAPISLKTLAEGCYRLSDWPAVFGSVPVPAQKMLLASLLREVRIGRGTIYLYAAFDWFGIGDA